jgi:CheY-like chemotaxis protein
MIIDERLGSSVVVVRKVDGLISAAWPMPAKQGTSQLDVREVGAASASTDGPPRVAADMHRFLIVDDDAESAEVLAMLLRATGRGETQLTRLGSAAVALAIEFRATIAFIDLKLPDMSGYEVARLLHQHPLLRELRLIALTDSDEHRGHEFARVAGFQRYVLKPVTGTGVEELLNA